MLKKYYSAFCRRKQGNVFENIMAKAFAKKIYNSSKYQHSRDSYIAERIKIDGGLCEICKEEPGYIVHHEEMLTESNVKDPVIAFSHSNFKYVCKKCHDKFEGHFSPASKSTKEKRYIFLPDGSISPPSKK